MNRRLFIRSLTTVAIAALLPTASGCQNQAFEPRPFATGRTITPPQGCTELLKRDPTGDC